MAMLSTLLTSFGAGGATANARAALERPASQARLVDEAMARVAPVADRADVVTADVVTTDVVTADAA